MKNQSILKIFVLVLLFVPLFSKAATKFNPTGSPCTFAEFMKRYVRQYKNAPDINSFLVAENTPHPDGEYWIYWPQQRQIFLMGWPVGDCKTPALSIRRNLDLLKDVVKTQKDVGTSTSLITEAWASTALMDAARNGYQVSVKK
jgi:hypothetical protein